MSGASAKQWSRSILLQRVDIAGLTGREENPNVQRIKMTLVNCLFD